MDFKEYKLLICDFDGVLTDNKVYVSEKGSETVLCSRSDGIGFRIFEQNGIVPIILSSETSPVVIQRAKKLKVKCFNNVKSKKNFLLESNELNILNNKSIYIGNDINDYEAMKLCKLKVCPLDAWPEIKDISDIVLDINGGDGVVRLLSSMFS